MIKLKLGVQTGSRLVPGAISTRFPCQQFQPSGSPGGSHPWTYSQLLNPEGPYVTIDHMEQHFQVLDENTTRIQTQLRHLENGQSNLESGLDKLDEKLETMFLTNDSKLKERFHTSDKKWDKMFEKRDGKMDTCIYLILGAILLKGGLEYWNDWKDDGADPNGGSAKT
ncbi:hypothetical protein B9Z19DRAFT_1141712 [Tuber borchii]|uniref:Uncharacterized protein n=1 Tax=Tuber borchii TaxID=42251 RepID=A0A2T6ZT36_TUBBO|nr:hypothetical protein B9Z19DRAFT_1141712 [Tuber borchii]